MHKAQRLINHVVLVLDASYSMLGKESKLTKVTDEQIKHLATRSEELQQETRVSVYRFGQETIECLIFDMDVMRLPKTADLYEVLYENTSLIDATLKSLDDLETTSQLYGDHAFLTFVLTDGEENRSKNKPFDLQRRLRNLDENWSIGFLVPDARGVRYMEKQGVLADSIATWDIAGTAGLDKAASSIKSATDNFMANRAKGVRGTRSVFSTGLDAVNKKTVKRNLAPLGAKEYEIFPVGAKARIDEFTRDLGKQFVKGAGYYQLTKAETIQPQKSIIVVDKNSGKAYTGDEARDLIGLPSDRSVRVRPDHNPLYDIFVQSTSINRNLMPNTKLLIRT